MHVQLPSRYLCRPSGSRSLHMLHYALADYGARDSFLH